MNLKNRLRVIEMIMRFSNRENELLYPLCYGVVLDIGCGHRKIHDHCIGVDILGKGEVGEDGVVKGKKSQADIKTSGDNLYMMEDGSVDAIVAKHNLEHYSNPLKTLKEWKRVLKVGGKVGVIVPDGRYIDTFDLDPSHKFEFTPAKLIKMFEEVGFKILDGGQALPHWSIYIIGEKV